MGRPCWECKRDGILAEFPSVINSMQCALGIQQKLGEHNAMIDPERHMQFRIGLNRLQSIAEPGQIFISRQVYDQVEGKLALNVRELGPGN